MTKKKNKYRNIDFNELREFLCKSIPKFLEFNQMNWLEKEGEDEIKFWSELTYRVITNKGTYIEDFDSILFQYTSWSEPIYLGVSRGIAIAMSENRKLPANVGLFVAGILANKIRAPKSKKKNLTEIRNILIYDSVEYIHQLTGLHIYRNLEPNEPTQRSCCDLLSYVSSHNQKLFKAKVNYETIRKVCVNQKAQFGTIVRLRTKDTKKIRNFAYKDMLRTLLSSPENRLLKLVWKEKYSLRASWCKKKFDKNTFDDLFPTKFLE
jgi:hypothetical protein